MKEEDTAMVTERVRNPANGLKFLENMFEHPIITIIKVEELLDVSYPTANTIVIEFCNLGILQQIGDNIRNKRYSYDRYIRLLNSGTEIIK